MNLHPSTSTGDDPDEADSAVDTPTFEPAVGITARETVQLGGDQGMGYPGPMQYHLDPEVSNGALFGLEMPTGDGAAIEVATAGLYRVSFSSFVVASASSSVLVELLRKAGGGQGYSRVSYSVTTMGSDESRDIVVDKYLRLAAFDRVKVRLSQKNQNGNIRAWLGDASVATATHYSGFYVQKIGPLLRREQGNEKAPLKASHEYEGFVSFASQFAATPDVQIGVTGWDDITSGHGYVHVEGVLPTGFHFKAGRSKGNRLDSLEFSWLAIGH